MLFVQDKRITGDGELSDSEDEGEGGRRDNRSYRVPQRKRPRLDKDVKDEVKCKCNAPGYCTYHVSSPLSSNDYQYHYSTGVDDRMPGPNTSMSVYTKMVSFSICLGSFAVALA